MNTIHHKFIDFQSALVFFHVVEQMIVQKFMSTVNNELMSHTVLLHRNQIIILFIPSWIGIQIYIQHK